MQPTTPTACRIVLELNFGIKIPMQTNPFDCISAKEHNNSKSYKYKTNYRQKNIPPKWKAFSYQEEVLCHWALFRQTSKQM